MTIFRQLIFGRSSKRVGISLTLAYLFTAGFAHAASRNRGDLSGSPQTAFNLSSFGGRPNDPRENSRTPLQQALDKLRSSRGGTLSIPAGDYYLDFPDIASDVDPRSTASTEILKTKALKKEKLILIPRGVMLQGMHDERGNPTTRIHWRATGFPLLSFANADGAGVKDIAFVFDGVQPQFFPWSQEDLLEEVGYRARWLGGPYEVSAVIYTIGSSNLRFENLSFESSKKPADNEHTFAFGIVSNGKNPVPQPDPNVLKTLAFGIKVPGGGLSDCVTNNVFRSLRFRDYVMGILAIGQCGAVIENIEGNYRGSWYRSFDPSQETGPELRNIGPPGHLIYLSIQYAYDVERSPDAPAGHQEFHSTTRNKDVRLRNIKEGPDTLSNVNSLGTLALKNIQGGLIADVVSQHPAGFIQTMVDAHDVLLENLSWSSDRDICEESQSSCNTPVISLAPGQDGSGTELNSGVRFRNVTLRGTRRPVNFRISEETGHLPLSRDISVGGLTIECTPFFSPKQGGPQAIIMVRSAATHFTNVRYIPFITNGANTDRQSYPALILSRSVDTTIEMSIEGQQDRARGPSVYKCVIEDERSQSAASNKCLISNN